MKFIVDAQLPKRLSNWIQSKGYDTIHTLDLAEQNLTQDVVIINLSMEEERIVISKDSDFYDYFVIKEKPHKLLMLTTGNITNNQLIMLFETNFQTIITLLEENKVVELNNNQLIVHF